MACLCLLHLLDAVTVPHAASREPSRRLPNILVTSVIPLQTPATRRRARCVIPGASLSDIRQHSCGLRARPGWRWSLSVLRITITYCAQRRYFLETLLCSPPYHVKVTFGRQRSDLPNDVWWPACWWVSDWVSSSNSEYFQRESMDTGLHGAPRILEWISSWIRLWPTVWLRKQEVGFDKLNGLDDMEHVTFCLSYDRTLYFTTKNF